MFLVSESGSHSNRTGKICFQTFDKPSHEFKDRQLLFYPDEHFARELFLCGMGERSLIQWARDNFVRPDKDFVDIGAHVGIYSVMCAEKSHHTYSFECNPKAFCYLAANTALHQLEDKISPLPYALGNRMDDHAPYIIRTKRSDGQCNGFAPVRPEDVVESRIPIPMRTLDSFGFDNVGFMKIDVEGFEKEVLEGAVETLKRNNFPPFIFESWPERQLKENGIPAMEIRKSVFDYITSLGYRIIEITGYEEMFLAAR